MHITTSTHILSLAEDHVYNLRRLGVQGDDSWLEARKGEAYNRHLQVKLHDNALHLAFEGQAIGIVSIANSAQVRAVVDFVQYWNLNVGPTDLSTTKTVELVRDWAQLLGTRAVRLRCVTWNCAGLLGETGLKVETWMRLIGAEHDVAQLDVIALAFQESDNLNRSVKSNPVTLQRCADLSSRYLYKTHKLVSSVQLLGLMTLVFVRHALVPLVSHVRTDTSSTGFLRVWGNKGAVLTRLHLLRDDILGGGLELSIVNCHLSAGEGITQLGRRRWELKEISSKFDIPGLAGPDRRAADTDTEADTSSISSLSDDEGSTLAPPPSVHAPPHDDAASDVTAAPAASADADAPDADRHSGDAATLRGPDGAPLDADATLLHMSSSKYLIVMGDLNYRVLMSEGDVLKKVKQQEWDGLLARDSLSIERQNGEVFRDFEEGAILFAPTYKYEIGSTKLKGRVPSYTDRILFRTRCEHKVESYASLTDLRSSDHRPVALATRLSVPNVVDSDKRAVVMNRALKLSDEAENNVRPKLSVDVQQVTLKGSPLSMQAQYIVIRNEGMRPLRWVIQNAQEQAAEPLADDKNKDKGDKDKDNKDKDKDRSAPASERERERDAAAAEREHAQRSAAMLANIDEVRVTPPHGEVSLTRPTSSVRLDARIDIRARDYILLVKPDGDYDGGIHQYVFVHIEPTRSYLGSTLKAMPQVDGIPVPVRECVDYLWDRRVPDMFLRGSDPQLFQQVLHWLDTDQPFDTRVLAAAERTRRNSTVYAVSNVLMALFQYLPDPLMGPGLKRRGSRSDWSGVTTYVCHFINRMITNEYEEPNLDVWATLLYDHNDERAGPNEKRAYLRSMLIVAEQQEKDVVRQKQQQQQQQLAAAGRPGQATSPVGVPTSMSAPQSALASTQPSPPDSLPPSAQSSPPSVGLVTPLASTPPTANVPPTKPALAGPPLPSKAPLPNLPQLFEPSPPTEPPPPTDANSSVGGDAPAVPLKEAAVLSVNSSPPTFPVKETPPPADAKPRAVPPVIPPKESTLPANATVPAVPPKEASRSAPTKDAAGSPTEAPPLEETASTEEVSPLEETSLLKKKSLTQVAALPEDTSPPEDASQPEDTSLPEEVSPPTETSTVTKDTLSGASSYAEPPIAAETTAPRVPRQDDTAAPGATG